MSERIVGYSLLVVGILTILISGLSVYQVFTKKSEPVQLFNFPAVSLNLGSLLGSGEGLTGEQQAALQRQKSQIKPQEIVSANLLNDTSNLAAHMFLMGFLATIGYKISSLGIQLLRPINVRLKEGTTSKA